ncbi:MAG: sulfite exporter TauE/SafE family protein [Chloroflexi bacterium]|nr:sulfite exporter TauE/SafE family protein [Chloroflexota bacterium]
MEFVYIFIATLLAAFTQSVSGFGLAMVSMPLLLSMSIGLQIATPYVALMSVIPEIILLSYYRKSLKIGAVWRLIVASLFGIGIGVLSLDYLDENIALLILGTVILLYSAYALLQFRLPTLESSGWAYLAGITAGFLGGAFNTTGPPIIMYGHSRGWQPAEFKGNLQAYFIINTVFIAIMHGIRGNYTQEIWQYYLYAGLPAIAIGLVAGIALDRFIQPELFRKIVLVALALIGTSLIIG